MANTRGSVGNGGSAPDKGNILAPGSAPARDKGMVTMDEHRSWAFEWLVGVLWIVLLWCWLKPVAEMSNWTEPEQIFPFYAIAAVYVLADVFRIPVWLGVPFKGAATLVCVGWLFRESGGHSGYGWDWLQAYAELCARDARAVAAGDWEWISPENRTMIFLLGWALLAGVIQSILLYRLRALLLLAVTWTYLLVLQLWPGLDTTREVIAAGAAGLALLSVLHAERIKRVHPSGILRRKPMKAAGGSSGGNGGEPLYNWGSVTGAAAAERIRFVPESGAVAAGVSGEAAGSRRHGGTVLFAASLLVTFILAIGALSGAGGQKGIMKPLGGPISSDVMSYVVEKLGLDGKDDVDHLLSSVKEGYALQAVSGYGSDDSRLGGPLTVNDVPVFTARTSEITYWRGESKSYYTGKGWSASPGGGAGAGSGGGTGRGAAVSLEAAASPSGTGASDAYRIIAQEILFQGPQPMNLLVAGGSIEKVTGLYTLEGRMLPEHALEADAESGRYALAPGWGQLGYAKLQVKLPAYRPEELVTLGLEPGEADLASTTTPAVPVMGEYLQLPDRLPERVKVLAEDVAGKAVTPYAKAVLVDQYLKENYRYSLTEVPVVGAKADFVDTFLFEGTGAGYCDYFSTAMVVLLRAEGVPARWVKGFAPGEPLSDRTEGLYTMQVSSKDAHSWVEVYIPGAGWIPFDPTPGFSGFTSGDAAQLASVKQQLAGGAVAGAAEPLSAGPSGADAGWLDWERIGSALEVWLNRAGELAVMVWKRYWLVLVGVVLALIPVLYLSRTKGHLLALLLLLRYRRRGPGHSALALKLLDRLWLRVFRLYGPKAPGQTFREYAEEAGARAPGARDALIELVQLYEQVRYAEGQPPWLPRRRMAELWRRLFDRPPRGGGMAV